MSVKKATKPTSKPTKIILFGLDEDSKPRAARFLEKEADAAAKAAVQLGLHVWRVAILSLPDAIARIPLGNVAATGMNITAKVPREVFEAVLEAATLDSPDRKATVPEVTEQDKAAVKNLKQPELSELQRQILAVAHERQIGRLPETWASIKEGSVVLVHQNRDDGWWEALVLKRQGNIITVRWRDFPRQPPTVRHVSSVALMCPKPL
ncbi:MAG: hypothetical protein KF854_00865 [Nitrospira sp.]|nr:hypothetical protein [Nitrospira sp.]MBX3513114.1 hypothetical protein [Xanthobacteraceae bacterium]